MTAKFTVAEFLTTLRGYALFSGTPIYGISCMPYTHADQPTVETLMDVLSQLADDIEVDALPLLSCGCYDLKRIRAKIGPKIDYLGMGIF